MELSKSEMPERLKIDRDDAVLIASFVNPPDGYMDEGSESALKGLLDAIDDDPSIRCVVFTGGQPDVFIRHYDVTVLEERAVAMAAKGMKFSADRPVPEPVLHQCMKRMESMPQVFIAAINGTAMGGGFELCLACDIRIVQSGNYSIGLPEVNIGILPGAGGTQRLPRLIGQARALELTLLGKTVGPDQAVQFGLATEVAPDGALDRAREVANEICAKSGQAVAHIKRLVRAAHTTDIDNGLAMERTLFCDLMVNEDGIRLMKQMNNGERDIRDRDRSCDK
jgi:enoyl-CoA hydratase